MKNPSSPKYAVFVDDGFDRVFNDKEKAKRYAARIRKEARSSYNGVISARVHRMTRDEIEMFG